MRMAGHHNVAPIGNRLYRRLATGPVAPSPATLDTLNNVKHREASWSAPVLPAPCTHFAQVYCWPQNLSDHLNHIILVSRAMIPPAHEPGTIRPMGPLSICESAEYSPSPGGEGRDEGGRRLFPQGHLFAFPGHRFMGAMRETFSGRSLLREKAAKRCRFKRSGYPPKSEMAWGARPPRAPFSAPSRKTSYPLYISVPARVLCKVGQASSLSPASTPVRAIPNKDSFAPCTSIALLGGRT